MRISMIQIDIRHQQRTANKHVAELLAAEENIGDIVILPELF